MDTTEIELFDREEMEDFIIGTWLVLFDLFCMMIFTVFLDSPAPNLWTLMNLGVQYEV